jgi:hypothetical protein
MRGVPAPLAVASFPGSWRIWRECDGLVVVLAGAAAGYGGDRRRPVTGRRARQPPRRRACVRRTRRKLPPRNGETPVEPRPPTAGHPGRSFPSTARARPRFSRPGRQAWRAEGAPLKT